MPEAFCDVGVLLLATGATTSPSASLSFWSGFVYWFAIANVILTIGFTFVVIVGGFFDLRYLFRALREEAPDVTDDGRVKH